MSASALPNRFHKFIDLAVANLISSLTDCQKCNAGGSIKAPRQSEEQELVRRSQAGDTQAFGELVTRYRAKLLTMLYGIVRNENDAGDLAQEGFLRAWRLHWPI